jgi:hypothetical protein
MMSHGQRFALGIAFCWAALVPAVWLEAADFLRAEITSSPTSAHVGTTFRVLGAIQNGGREPVEVHASIWIIRPWGEFFKLGTVRLELAAGEARRFGVPCYVDHEVPAGPHAIGLVIASPGGRFIADHAPIRILPRAVAEATTLGRAKSGSRSTGE